MNRAQPFSWPLSPLLEEARETLAAREDEERCLYQLLQQRAAERVACTASLAEARGAETAALTAIDSAVASQVSREERERVESAFSAAQYRTVMCERDLELAGEAMRDAERRLADALDARTSAELAVKELRRLHDRDRAAYDRQCGLREDVRLEDELIGRPRQFR